MLSFMGISGIFGKINLSKISINLKVPDEIYQGKPVLFKVELINNKKFFPVLLSKINIFGKNGIFLFVDKKSKEDILLELEFNKRGIYRLEKITVCSVFPFNFFTRCKNIDVSYEITVFPKPKPCKYYEDNIKKEKKGEFSSKNIGFYDELISIRDYKAGDPLKYISWKATAKTEKLKTKELSLPSANPVVIDFSKIPTKNIEDKLSCTTFLILELYKRKVPFGLKIENNIFKPDFSRNHKIRLLKELARYGLEK